jgi:hypothetical protein
VCMFVFYFISLMAFVVILFYFYLCRHASSSLGGAPPICVCVCAFIYACIHKYCADRTQMGLGLGVYDFKKKKGTPSGARRCADGALPPHSAA